MQTQSSTHVRVLSLVFLALWAVGPRGMAQTPAELGIQTNAGLTITGAVGNVYTVQYRTNLAEPADWQGAGIVQLPSSPYLWIDTSAPIAGRRFYRTVEGPTNMVWIPPGAYTMGSPGTEAERDLDEGPQTVVTLTQGFFMGKYEVTQGEYLVVTGNNPSYFRNGTIPVNGGTGGDVTDELRHPVEKVDWVRATDYCAQLTEQEQIAGRLPAGWHYRLPTVEELEYACRAGTTSAFHYGLGLLSGMANFDGRSEYDSVVGTIGNPAGINLGRTAVVGSYEANGWGLNDMHGNVRELCSDFSSNQLPGGRVIDPQGSATGFNRLCRGGNWLFHGWDCRSAMRSGEPPASTGNHITGFRVVLAPTQP